MLAKQGTKPLQMAIDGQRYPKGFSTRIPNVPCISPTVCRGTESGDASRNRIRITSTLRRETYAFDCGERPALGSPSCAHIYES